MFIQRYDGHARDYQRSAIPNSLHLSAPFISKIGGHDGQQAIAVVGFTMFPNIVPMPHGSREFSLKEGTLGGWLL